MKRILSVVIYSAYLYFATFAFAETDGFRGIQWGEKFELVKGDMAYMRTDPSHGGVKKYSKKQDELKIGAAVLTGIEYGFWQEKFSSVDIMTNGYTNFAALKDATFQKFGHGSRSNPYMEKYFWVTGKTPMILQYNEISGVGSLWMFSEDINIEQRNYDKKQASDGAKSGF